MSETMNDEKQRGRPRKATSRQWTVYIEENLALRLDLLFMNPVSGKTAYGYRNSLVNKLLREWLAQQTGDNI